jgi:hypothetical protein
MSMFIDESKAKGYRLAVTLIAETQSAATRAILVDQVLPGQRRIHFAKESDRRRKLLLSKLAGLGTTTHIYRVDGLPELDARRICLAAALEAPRALDVVHVVLEIDPSIVAQDRRAIADVLRRQRRSEDVSFSHSRPESEPLLWIPDAVAWSHARGAEWLRRLDPLVDGVTVIRP